MFRNILDLFVGLDPVVEIKPRCGTGPHRESHVFAFYVKKPKKAVKISVEEKKAAKSEEKPKPKGPSKKKVEPLVATDVEW